MLQAHQLSEHLDRTQPVKSLARSERSVNALPSVLGQVDSLGKNWRTSPLGFSLVSACLAISLFSHTLCFYEPQEACH